MAWCIEYALPSCAKVPDLHLCEELAGKEDGEKGEIALAQGGSPAPGGRDGNIRNCT